MKHGPSQLILTLLEDGPMYALDMIEQSGGLLKRGAIYVILSRMEHERLVTSFLVEPTDDMPPPRRQYKLTADGRSRALTLKLKV